MIASCVQPFFVVVNALHLFRIKNPIRKTERLLKGNAVIMYTQNHSFKYSGQKFPHPSLQDFLFKKGAKCPQQQRIVGYNLQTHFVPNDQCF